MGPLQRGKLTRPEISHYHNKVQRNHWRRSWWSTFCSIWSHSRHAINFIWKMFCLPFDLNFSSLEQKSSDERGGDVFIQVVASASMISIFFFHSQHKTFNQSPTLFAVMWKPTIWQSSQSKPKRDSSDSWRLVCKIKQKEILYFFWKSCLLLLQVSCHI